MDSNNTPTTNDVALLQGLNMIKSIVNDLLSGDEDLKLGVMIFYEGFRLAADGFIGASYLATTQAHKDIIKSELLKYITEVKERIEKDDKILKFSSGKPEA